MGLFDFRGRDGRVTIRDLGALVCIIGSWTLNERRGDQTAPGVGLYDLRAVCSYANQALWDEYPDQREIVVQLNSKMRFTLEPVAGVTTMSLSGSGLVVNGVIPKHA